MIAKNFKMAVLLSLFVVAIHNASFGQALPPSAAKSPMPSVAVHQGVGAQEGRVQSSAVMPNVKLGPPKSGPKVKNPQAMQANAAIVGVLQKQRNAANLEASQMKLSIRTQGQAGMLGQQSQMMSANGGRATVPMVQSQAGVAINNGTKSGTGAQSQNRATVAAPVTIRRTQTVGSIGPGQTSSAVGNASGTGTLLPQGSGAAQSLNSSVSTGSSGNGSGSTGNSLSSAQHLTYMDTTVLTCTHDPTMRILNVSGSSFPATFTPIDQYNLYTIAGCSFGNPGPSGKVYIYGTGTFQVNFVIKFWSDNSIVVSLDPSLSGYPDLTNLTLVVQRADSQQAQKGGFKFYAARQTVPLSTIPSSWVKLPTMWSNSNALTPQYSSPPSPTFGFPGYGSVTGSAYVSRFYNGQKFDPNGTFDYYDFSQLAAGWTTDSFQLVTYDQTCPLTVTYSQSFGTWAGNWDGNNIRISLSDTSCSSFNPIMPLQNWQNLTGSYYALKVWVTGPRSTDPLTDNPTH